MNFTRNGHPLRWPMLIAALAPVVAVAAVAAPAEAGVVETPNACKFTYDDEYRTQGIEVTASAPAQAQAGQAFKLSGQKLEVKLRPQLASDAAQADLLPSSPGGTQSTVVTKTWFALKGTNTLEGTKVIGPITVNATTTAFFDEAGQTITATPFQYTAPKLPDTTWTATGGNIAFSQAGPDAITAAKGQLPVGGGGSPATVQGSAVVQANLPNGVNFYMDCEPGVTNVTRPQAGAGTTFNPLTPAAFAAVAVAGKPSNPGGAPPVTPPGRIGSTKLVAKASKVRLKISCRDEAVDCAGIARLKTRSKVRIGGRKAKVVTLARSVRYKVSKGKSKTISLKLSRDGKALLRLRRTRKATVTLKPREGKSATRKLTLRRG